MDECLVVIRKEKHDKTSVIHAFADSQLILLVNSFMEEWEDLGSQCKNDDRIVKVRKVAAPFTRRIKQWSDLRNFRNTLIAHNFRNTEGKNVLVNGYSGELNIPNGFPDRVLMCGCAYCIKEILINEFSFEYNELIAYLKSIQQPTIKEGIKTEEDAKKELDRLITLSEDIRASTLKNQNG